MRKLVFFLLLAALGWSAINGQTGRPCAEYDQNRDVSGMKEILMMDGTFYTNLRTSYAEAINYGIGKNVVTTSKYGMEYVLENTVLLDVNFIVPGDYLNGVRFGDKVTFTTLTGQPSDKWAAFRYEGVDYVYAKVSCMNPQRIKKIGSFLKIKSESEPITFSTSKQEDWSFSSPRKIYEERTVDLNLFKSVEKEKKFKWKPVLIVGGVVVVVPVTAYGIYSLLHHHHDNGVPGGASSTTDHERPVPVITPPVVVPVPVVPGGPGGAPASPNGK